MDISISRDDGRHRYQAHVGNVAAGYCEYRRSAGVIALTHTVVSPGFEGRGVGSALAVRALDDARSEGLQVEPACSFIAAYIVRHPAYADLVPPGFPASA